MLPGSSGGDDGGEERETARAEKERAKGGRDMEKEQEGVISGHRTQPGIGCG
jgi:hypothetical protein